MYGGINQSNISPQDHVRRKIRNTPLTAGKLSGQIAIIEMKKEPKRDEQNICSILPKRRKFGDDYRNVEIMETDDEECKDLSLVFRVNNKNTKRVRARTVAKLHPIPNENSNDVKEKGKEMQLESEVKGKKVPNRTNVPEAIKSINTSHCLSLPCSSSCLVPSKRSEKKQAEVTPWVKRKFYIFKNAGRAGEVYCTDFMTNVRQGHIKRAHNPSGGNDGLLKIVDNWREEWNQGVQMPLGGNKEAYHYEATLLHCDIPDSPPFGLPKKLISHYQCKYTKVNAKEFQKTVRQPLCSYLIDLTDKQWLSQEGETGMDISERTFVEVMNLLEITTYQRIHEALLEPLEKLKVDDDDAECMICRLTESEIGDNIVFCDGCNVSVHQSCYGISKIPNGAWFCQLCEHYGKPVQQPCLFCPVKGGPMKPTKHTENWAHIVCALWIPEVRFGNVETREPITHVNEIQAEKWQSRCCVCDTRSGACIKCMKCEATFHVSCAQRADFTMNIVNDSKSDNGVRMVSLCDKHSTNSSPHRMRRIQFHKNRLPDMMRNFTDFVDAEEIMDALGVSEDVLGRIYSYWMWKRERNDYKPLISEPEIFMDVQYPAEKPLSRSAKSSSKRRKTANIYDGIPEERLQRNYEGIRMLRLNFEKARNLCYMVGKREKLKKSNIEVFEEQIRKVSAPIFCEHPVIPVSKRRIEKILAELRDVVEFRSPVE